MTHQRDLDGRVSRRTLMRGAAGLGLAAATGTLLPGCSSGGEAAGAAGAAAGDRLETTTIRVARFAGSACVAAQVMAKPFLREEGFTDVQYPLIPLNGIAGGLAAGDVDLTMGYGAMMALRVDAGDPIVMLSGVHVGCWEVFGGDGIRSLRDFKGKTVAVSGPAAPDGVFMAMTLANVGLDLRDINLVTRTPVEARRLLAAGRIDGLVALPPNSLELRAKRIGHVVLNSMADRPWSGYFCCMAAVNRTWMEKHPVATRRALRAVLKGADVVAREPARTAAHMTSHGFTTDRGRTGEILKEIPYDVWRDLDPLDSVRFYALRLKEAGFIKATPEQLIKRGTDFSHLAALKQELVRAG